MRIHLLTSDTSVFALTTALAADDTITAVIIPQNRASSEKVRAVRDACLNRSLPIFEHPRGGFLPTNMPPADTAISWLYSQIIKVEDLTRYGDGMLNMHGGRIPEYRGASVLQWQIINGETELGITWHEIMEEVDAGPIWAESTIPIPEHADAAAMRQAMINEAIEVFPEAWHNARSRSNKQRLPDLSRGQIWPSRRPKDGTLRPNMTEKKIRDLVRALCPPWPPARIKHQDQWFNIIRVSNKGDHNHIAYNTAEGTTIYLQVTPLNQL